MRSNSLQGILLDADVVIHFAKGGRLLYLNKIFPNPLFILDVVLDGELKKRKELSTFYDNLVNYNIATAISFRPNNEDLQEYAKLIKRFGEGESASMIYCKRNKNILASSNLKDIKKYCDLNGIKYLTTMDFLHEAYKREVMSEAECDLFIYEVKSKGSKLPFDTIKDYISSFTL